MEAPRQVEMILKHGSKSSTYKYALLKGLIDYILEHPTEEPVNGFHYIPTVYLSKKFLRYYWPLWKAGITQSNREKIRLIHYFKQFEEEFSSLDEGYALDSKPAVFNILERIDSAVQLPTPYIKMLQRIRSKMVDQPLRKVRKVRGEVSQIFTAYHRGYSIIETDTDEIFDEGKKNIKRSDRVKNYLELEDKEQLHVLIPHRVYQELVELRFWVDSVITKHWSEECQNYMEGDQFNHGEFYSSLSRDLGERPDLTHYREIYDSFGVGDFYTGKSLRSMEIDHFLPWSRLPVNKFWNLVPTSNTINREKSDKLVVLNDYIRDQALPEHIDRCLSTDEPFIQNEIRATYQKYFKRPMDNSDDKVIEELRELVLQLYDSLDKVMVEEKYEIEEVA